MSKVLIPQVGDTVSIESDYYKGKAVVTYIDEAYLFVHHMLPIQVQIHKRSLKKVSETNGIQYLHRFNLKEIKSIDRATF